MLNLFTAFVLFFQQLRSGQKFRLVREGILMVQDYEWFDTVMLLTAKKNPSNHSSLR